MSDDPVSVVHAALMDISAAVHERDAQRFIGLFTADGVLFGSLATEYAVGTQGLTVFAERFFANSFRARWMWDPPEVGCRAETVWFAGPATVVLEHDAGGADELPYRLSGVLVKEDGGWRFALFNSSEPVADE